MKAPIELLRCWLHETQRVYGDRLLEEKDLEMLNKLQVDITKKIFEVSKLSRCCFSPLLVSLIFFEHFLFPSDECFHTCIYVKICTNNERRRLWSIM